MPPKQKWWPEGSEIEKRDAQISAKVFHMNLGKLEWPLSLFHLFRIPLSLMVCPVSLAVLAGGPRPMLTFLVWLVAAAAMMQVWFSLCLGKVRQTSKYLFSLWSLGLAPPLGLLLARVAGEEAFGVAAFYTTAWFTVMMPVVVLKHKFARKRPAVVPGMAPPSRMIITLSKLPTQDAHTSFPSGDAAAAVAYAVPLAVACGWPLTALLVLSGVAVSTMYWRFHYALDLAAGAAIGLVVVVLLHATVCPIGAVKWWQPLVAQALMIGCTFVVRRLK